MIQTDTARKALATFFLAGIALLLLAPIILTVTNSLMTEQEISTNYGAIGQIGSDSGLFVNLKLLPDWVSWEQYAKVLVDTPQFLLMFWNSVLLVVPIIAGQVAVASLAAYAFAKLKFRGRDKLFLVYLMTMLMPFQVTLVPNYIIADRLGLMNSQAAIILPGIFAAFGVFLLRQFMLHIPYTYMEAAKIDGAGQLRIFFTIVMPLVKPALAALVVLLFADNWNMVEQPLIFLQDAFKQPLSVYLSRINGEALGVAFAASVLYMTPMVLLFLYAEPHFIEGVQLSGVKG
ncbi:carbohydrate ABC transporter permease [Paenibacillus doosanensis]|uniref:L-arabinose transport system permease protein AraQ n=1 Tax=Paenibacillus konkukensis TaxID=2020716 RepID=A0ABY4RIC4_9BACL|nr:MULTISPECIES: carbohydrate ABC transporter permease [Paenibacillus]MCS7460510.1 carbohydrate ABC transporter permease [Paenibacillus doosanensis]UQZ81268.1 L-arabinose transport system permease protein AraQ [Paenibacillus konkukensis]